MDFDSHTWDCTTNTDSCPGGPVNGVGCPMPDCEYSVNPFGSCDCDEQLFISSDCKEGFYCQSNIPDPFLYEGCIQRCFDNQILIPDFVSHQWRCVDEELDGIYCPGKLDLRCPDNDIGHGFNSSICQCNGQLHVSGDCRESFHCISWLEGGGNHQVCPEGMIVDYNPISLEWTCSTNTDNCPGLGGFQIGCEAGGIPLPQPDCEFDDNPFGTCDGCEGQMFISEDCSESFYCTQAAPEAPHGGGCHLTCNNETERVHLDYSTNTWECVPREPSFSCPGRFQVDCVDQINVNCHCDHEFWMRPDCQMAFLCTEERTPTGQNIGKTIWCFEGEVLHIDLATMEYSCTTDIASCPGSYHFGCEGGDFGDLTTSTTTTTTDTTTISGTTTTRTTSTTQGGADTTTSSTTQGGGDGSTTSTTQQGSDTTTTSSTAETTTRTTTLPSSGNGPPVSLTNSLLAIGLNLVLGLCILN